MSKPFRNMYFKKKALSTVALILVLAVSMLMASMSTVSANTPPQTHPTWAYIALSPSPVGVGQSVYVIMWVSPNPPTATGYGGDVWRDLKVTITAPDGSTSTLGPYNADATGSTFASFTPSQVGTYTFDFVYPGQVISLTGPTGIPSDLGVLAGFGFLLGGDRTLLIGDTYLGSHASETLTVQQQAIATIPDTPLPTGYWTRPIFGQNSNWEAVASNWLGGSQIGGAGNMWQAGAGPSSSHILWTKPLETGGIVGGTTGVSSYAIADVGFYGGGSYEGRFTNAMIIDGKLFYANPLGHSATGGGYTAVDLKTGETVWHSDDLAKTVGNIVGVGPDTILTPSFGQLYDYESQNQHGVVGGILWAVTGTTWSAYDSFTGKFLYNLTNVPGGTTVYDNTGAIVRYVLSYSLATKSGTLALWNNSAHNAGLELTPAGSNATVAATTNAYQWRPNGGSFDMGGSYAYSWNVSINADLTGNGPPGIVKVIPGDIILGQSTPGLNAFFSVGTGGTPPYTLWAISDKPATRGQLLWIKTYDPPAGGVTRTFGGSSPIDTVNRAFFMQDTETFAWTSYSLDTGAQLWGPIAGTTRAFSYYGSGLGGGQIGWTAYGNLYTQGFGGEICAFNGKTGDLIWKFSQTNSGIETVWGNYPIFIGAIADGKVYAFNNEHSPNYPLYKGEQVYAINAYDGTLAYKLLGWAGQSGGPGTSTMVMADGVVCYYNYYDNQIYAIGKGPSATTVTAPTTAVTQGTTALIQGTVTDQSAGAKAKVASGEFSIVPAISDADQSAWMENLYMQQSIAGHNLNGVPVSVDAVSSSGAVTHIGDTTSDGAGQFAISWTAPQATGTYTIVASFAGSNSYGASHEETHMIVTTSSGNPIVTATPTNAPSPNAETPVALYVGIAAAVVIIAVIAAAVILRRRK
jgi:hypothetical protein